VRTGEERRGETTHIPAWNHLAVSGRRAGLGGTQGKAAGRGLSILGRVSGVLNIPSSAAEQVAAECVAGGLVNSQWDVDSDSPEGQLLHINSFCSRSAGSSPRQRHGQRITLPQDGAIDKRVRTKAGLTILPTVASGSNENTWLCPEMMRTRRWT
jgi:hypothetical protein